MFQKSAYVRMCIWEISKIPTYEFHYDYIKDKYGNKSRLLFTDANSYMYDIDIEKVFVDFSKNKEMSD